MTASSDKINYDECCLHDQKCGALSKIEIQNNFSGAGAE